MVAGSNANSSQGLGVVLVVFFLLAAGLLGLISHFPKTFAVFLVVVWGIVIGKLIQRMRSEVRETPVVIVRDNLGR